MNYSDYYEKQFSSNPVDGYNFLEKKMKEASPSGGYACLAFLLTQTPHKVVVTTNFDRLTEDAVTLYAHEFSLVVGHVAMAHYITSDVARPTVVKIHHDLLLDPKSKNADLQQLDERWQKALSEIFSKYHPIFIGFAGNDPDVMDYLIDNADKFQKGNEWKRPYWTVYGTENPKGKVKDFLNKSGAFLIHNNGFDDTPKPTLTLLPNNTFLEVKSMKRLISCEYNFDTACVELKFTDGSMISIDTIAVENEVARNMYERSDLDYLIYNDAIAYADLVLNGDPKKYLKTVTEYKSLD